MGLKGSIVASTLGKMQAIEFDDGCQSSSTNSTNGRHCAISLKNPHLSNFLPDGGDESDEVSETSESSFVIKAGVRCRYVFNPENQVLLDIPNTPLPVASGDQRKINGEDKTISRKDVCCESLDNYLSSGQPSEADVAKSLLSMVTFNVTQLAYLNAVLYKCKR